MARIQIQFHCGCGFKTDFPPRASEHADHHDHILTIQGQVYPEKQEYDYAQDDFNYTAAKERGEV